MPRRRRRYRRLFHTVAATTVAVLALYVIGFALVGAMRSDHYSVSELLVPRLVDVLVFLWLFWVGSAIGSFLNVVAWRMPRGESINGRSYCPRCQARLAARDNVPVFGWLALGGRCRTCRLPISPRYPMVEALVGGCISAIGVAELYRLSLPLTGQAAVGGWIWAPTVTTPQLLVLLYHVVAVSASFACGLIRLDGNKLPPRLMVFTLAVLTLPLLVYPPAMIVPWQVEWPSRWPPEGQHLDALLRILCSLSAACLASRALARSLCPTADLKLDPLGAGTARLVDLTLLLLVPATVTGWQSFPAVLLLSALVARGLQRWTLRPQEPLASFALAVPIALTLQLAAWRPLHHFEAWPSIDSSPWLILTYSLAALSIPLWLRPRHSPATDAATHGVAPHLR